jgi:hypothetical protein
MTEQNVDFVKINEALEAEEGTFKVELITLAGAESITVDEGTTVADFKEENDLEGVKLVSGTGVILEDSEVIEQGTRIFVSTFKENG